MLKSQEVQRTQILGILDLEPAPVDNVPPTPGTLRDPAIFDFHTIRETIRDAWVEVVVRGDAALETPYIAAAQSLVKRGAAAITSDCGFSIRHQAAVAAAVDVPVALSALILVPTILRQLPAKAKLAILTFDATFCETNLLGINHPADQARVVIGGIENSQSWANEIGRPQVATDHDTLQKDVCSRIANLRNTNPEIGAVLLECTMFLPITQSIRHFTGLPVYDITTLCRMVMESVGAHSD